LPKTAAMPNGLPDNAIEEHPRGGGRKEGGYPITEVWREPLLAVLAAQLGTPRGRCDEHNVKFPSIVKPRFNRPVGERNHF
jgi:hypothetical protein